MNIESEIAKAEKSVYGNVCRSCDRPIENGLTVADPTVEWPECNECDAKKDRLILDMPDFGCVVWFEGEKNAYGLMCCEEGEFYKAGGVAEANEQLLTCDLTAPENQEFLDHINDAFGTNLRFDEFAGR